MTCRKCGREVEPGTYLPYRHIDPRGAGHYAVVSRSSAGLQSSPPTTPAPRPAARRRSDRLTPTG